MNTPSRQLDSLQLDSHPLDSRHLDFGPMGMKWEFTATTGDSQGHRLEAINELAPGFRGPPMHVHPSASEIYQVLAGQIEVNIDGRWQTLGAGQTMVVPPGAAHTFNNDTDQTVRILNTHQPAMAFERFFRRLHALAASGQVTFPPRRPKAAMLLAMLFIEHEAEMFFVKPPQTIMRVLARLGRCLRYKLPA